MTQTLSPFNLVSVCPKCGMRGGGPPRIMDGVTGLARIDAPDPFPVEYHPSAQAFGRFPCALELHVEHLCRTCPRCRFAWAEACPQFPDNPVVALAISQLRPEVWAFALLMERELAKHDDRGGWQDCGKPWLLIRLREQVEKLAAFLDDYPAYLGHRAADTANFCMMIADVGGALDSKEET